MFVKRGAKPLVRKTEEDKGSDLGDTGVNITSTSHCRVPFVRRHEGISSKKHRDDIKKRIDDENKPAVISKVLKNVANDSRCGSSMTSVMMGPLNNTPSHIRINTFFDYAPDVCKDYKETGYCGWGDTCKFLHDRSDYKSGWQLEKEWDEEQKRKQERVAMKLARRHMGEASSSSSDGSEDSDGLPFACLICKAPWTEKCNPVVTLCEHYFCERCALTHYSKAKGCAACNEPTNGVFNVATNVVTRMHSEITRGKKKRRTQDDTCAHTTDTHTDAHTHTHTDPDTDTHTHACGDIHCGDIST
eukprot:GHVR01174306.1.p1 GENE.GHVR01174306.1~~GHVR01174306.1.p1  ORF type:complete len:302 (-),score=77.53 GHVR01174306.1:111-1016(-)